MSNIHVLEKDTKNKTVNCIFHIPVPDTNNAVGTNWRDVIQRAENPEPMMSYNDATENANTAAGNILERNYTVRFTSTNLTNAQRLAQIEAAYDENKDALFDDLKDRLDFFGKTA